MTVMDNVRLEDLPKVADEIISKSHRIIGFEGDLGAGKTTLIKEICRKLGVKDSMSSPTFSIVNTYNDPHGQPVYHFDLYRIKDVEECLDMGMVDYLDSGHYCLIEWPEIAKGILDNYELSLIKVEQIEDNLRRIFVIHK